MLSYLTHLGVFLFKRCFIVEHPSPDGLLLLIHVIFNRTNTNEEARRRVYAIASRLKVTIVTTIKKDFPTIHILHILHTIKKEAGNGTKRETKGLLTF